MLIQRERTSEGQKYNCTTTTPLLQHFLHIMLEQNVFNITSWEFWWQQGIKNCQLDMLIFDQVCRTIDKNLVST